MLVFTSLITKLEDLGYAPNKREVYVLAVGNRSLRTETNTNNLPLCLPQTPGLFKMAHIRHIS